MKLNFFKNETCQFHPSLAIKTKIYSWSAQLLDIPQEAKWYTRRPLDVKRLRGDPWISVDATEVG